MISIRASLLFLLGTAGVGLAAAEVKAPPVVRTATPTRGEVLRYVSLPGNLRANQQATLYAKVAGYLKTMPVDKGTKVHEGDLLSEIEVPELLADLKKYEADAKVSDIELQRLSRAEKRAPDLVLPDAVDKARAASEIAQANIQRTNTLLGFARIVAPFSGVITMRYVDPGAFVPAATSGSAAQNAALVTLMDFSVIRTQVYVPEPEVPFVHEGQPVKVLIEVLPGKTFAAKVTRFSYALDEATRTMLAEIDLPNPESELRPGMYATVKIGVEKHENALLVPSEAIVMEKTNAFVFKLVNPRTGDQQAKKVAVTLGFNDGVNAEVLTGITGGETIILPGKVTLADGMTVQVTEAK